MVDIETMKCGLVALIGVPNAGKSTLMNALVGEKVGIISNKPNTTRVTVRGVLTEGDNQLIFMDTPGLNRSAKAFDRRLVQQAQGAAAEADILLILCDVSAMRGKPADTVWSFEKQLVDAAKARKQKVVIALTKIDVMKEKSKLLPTLTALAEWGVDAVVPLSAMKDNGKNGGVSRLVAELVKMLPKGPWLFPADQVTDMPVNFRLAELTREQAMRLLHQELPYGVGVVTEKVEEVEDGLLLVQQQLLVAKEQHRPMVLGAGGQMLKKIGTLARKEMQEVMGKGVRLELHVKVAERWLEREQWLREMGV
jgi:GTP-binding protein Era